MDAQGYEAIAEAGEARPPRDTLRRWQAAGVAALAAFGFLAAALEATLAATQ